MTTLPIQTAPKLRLTQQMEVSIIVPTLNEAANLRPLLDRIDSAMTEQTYEVIIVDDNSTDDTLEICRRLAAEYPLRMIERSIPTCGLSGAVLRGMEAARGVTIVVMDADLQHPPESIPTLIAALEFGAEFALGSRYVIGGCTEQNWGRWREMNSGFATLLAKLITGQVRDPMSGFFAISRQTFRKAQALNPIGYKIALELLCKCGIKQIMEVPIAFGVREAGESKLTWKQRTKFIQHLARLYGFKFPRSVFALKCSIAAMFAATFAALTSWTLVPLLTLWAVVATTYAARASRPKMKEALSIDHEIDLRGKPAPIERAA